MLLGKLHYSQYLRKMLNLIFIQKFVQAYPSYAFDYAVKDPHTGDNKAQWEKRDGDLVKGKN